MTTTAIAISGGVDSLVAAHLLKTAGQKVVGLHFVTGYETDETGARVDRKTVADRIAAIEAQLAIPVHVLDLSDAFQQHVVTYFVRSYNHGRTPNPCLVCNPAIKFGLLLVKARQLGADRLATGHYARIQQKASGAVHLMRGVDHRKDQSYFLAFLNRAQLQAAIFPLGSMTKEETRRTARQHGLVPITTDESQDVCFIKDSRYGTFLANQSGFESRAGDIVDLQGRLLGRHPGLHLFTVGQRRGINCPGPAPYYVVRIETNRNRLVVGFKEDLTVPACRVSDVNWIHMPPDGPITVRVRIRYRHRAVPALVTPLDNGAADIRFKEPQEAVTPGQGAVFYQGEEVLGGGWIDEPFCE